MLIGLVLIGIAAGIEPRADRYTWFLETVPVMIALPLLLLTQRRFPFTPIAYRLMWIFALILIIGGHYTYAQVPLFNWLRDSFELTRNHYDRIGHLMQGVAPAIVAREILLRRSPLARGALLFFLVVCVALAISAGYELIEWAAASINGEAAAAFLGTQGDPWDTQWDMFLALNGAVFAQLLFGRVQDEQLRDMDPTLLYRKGMG